MILIVDDKKENLFSLKTLLQLHGYEVDTASSGEETLKKILKTEYALVILDVQMPGMDGFEVAESITSYSKTRNIPIIFLSAVNTDKRFITKGYVSGGVDYVTKPFDPDLLLLKVQTFVRLHQQAKELNEMRSNLEKKVEERTAELKTANKALETSNLQLEQYAYIASHDLQEPLRKIITFCHIVDERYLVEGDDARKYMNKIISASERMKTLINDLLEYSRLSIIRQFVESDLKQILQDTLSDLELIVREKRALIEVGNLPEMEVIPDQIRQVFLNIISNALKFSKPGEQPVIKIQAERIAKKSFETEPDPDGAYVKITVTDNGIGFDETYSDRIFTMFQRLHGRAEYAGTGMGLAIVKKIIENHNGLLTAHSKEGQGSAFSFIIPIKQTA
jgi:signal transduction histidine kinase